MSLFYKSDGLLIRLEMQKNRLEFFGKSQCLIVTVKFRVLDY